MNWKTILNLTGIVVIIISIFMLLPLGVSFYFNGEDLKALVYSFMVTLFSGAVLFLFTRRFRKDELRHRDGFVAVTVSWITVALLVPFPFSSHRPLPRLRMHILRQWQALLQQGRRY